jgi:hypothetical protein
MDENKVDFLLPCQHNLWLCQSLFKIQQFDISHHSGSFNRMVALGTQASILQSQEALEYLQQFQPLSILGLCKRHVLQAAQYMIVVFAIGSCLELKQQASSEC